MENYKVWKSLKRILVTKIIVILKTNINIFSKANKLKPIKIIFRLSKKIMARINEYIFLYLFFIFFLIFFLIKSFFFQIKIYFLIYFKYYNRFFLNDKIKK